MPNPITQAQRTLLDKLFQELNWGSPKITETLVRRFGVKEMANLTSKEAGFLVSDLIATVRVTAGNGPARRKWNGDIAAPADRTRLRY